MDLLESSQDLISMYFLLKQVPIVSDDEMISNRALGGLNSLLCGGKGSTLSVFVPILLGKYIVTLFTIHEQWNHCKREIDNK